MNAPIAQSLRVDYVSPSVLKPDLRNARTHSKAQVEQIAGSMRSFGFANPILVERRVG